MDYGVVVFSNISVVRDYFAHWDIPLVNLDTSASSGGTTKLVNFETGEVVMQPRFTQAEIGAALAGYAAQLAKYPGIAIRYDLPYPVPEDLLMNFGDFLEKYNITAVSDIAYLYNQGLGNPLAQPTLFAMKYLDMQQVLDLKNGFPVNALNDNQLIYDKAQAELGSSVFLNSYPTQVVRNENGVSVLISTPSGPKLIRASRLLISIPPTLSNLHFLDLEVEEATLFSQFNNSYYWDAIIRNTGIPDGVSVNNNNPAAPLAIPAMPSMYSLGSTPIPGIFSGYYGSAHYMSDDEVRTDMLATIERIREGLGYPAPADGPEIVELNNHAPFMMTVSTDDVQQGFYKQLQALQGQRRTWYTGAAWNRPASADLWRFTEEFILPYLVA